MDSHTSSNNNKSIVKRHREREKERRARRIKGFFLCHPILKMRISFTFSDPFPSSPTDFLKCSKLGRTTLPAPVGERREWSFHLKESRVVRSRRKNLLLVISFMVTHKDDKKKKDERGRLKMRREKMMTSKTLFFTRSSFAPTFIFLILSLARLSVSIKSIKRFRPCSEWNIFSDQLTMSGSK